jgi:superfamily II DNA or RNA helicase
MQLRPYQEKAIEEMRSLLMQGKNRLILCSPTGSGKTVIFSHMAKLALQKGKKVLIVTDRIELMQQSGRALHNLGMQVHRIEAGRESYFAGQLYTGMVETLARRTRDARYLALLKGFDLIIFDEAHKQSFDKLFEHIGQNTAVIGATATPMRKGAQISLDKNYQAIVETTGIPDLIEQGFLVPCRTYGVPVDLSDVKMKGTDYDEKSMGDAYSKNRVYEGVIENYLRLCPGSKTIAFSPNIDSSLELCQKMQLRGINAKHLDSNMSKMDRVRILAWFKKTPDAVLCNVGILTTGFDEPAVETIILYRATTSLPLFLQMAGRGSRIHTGKTHFNLLDFGENVKRHGFWEDNRSWNLEKKVAKKKGAIPAKNCKECNGILNISVMICPYCGYEFERRGNSGPFAELIELSPAERRYKASGATLEQKAAMCKAGLIKPFWVLHNLHTIEEAKRFVMLMGWKPGWVHVNRDKFGWGQTLSAK